MRSFPAIIAIATVVITACGGDASSAPQSARVHFALRTATLGAGSERLLTLVDSSGERFRGPGVQWRTSDTTIAKVIDNNGYVLAGRTGSAWVVAALGGGRDSISLTVQPLAFTAIAPGAIHACALTPAGELYCWGANNAGEVAGGNATVITHPLRAETDVQFTQVVAGEDESTCGIDRDGHAWCWGNSEFGQLGRGAQVGTAATPTQVAGDHVFTQLTAGWGFACGLTSVGDAYCWGLDSFGEVGAGQKIDDCGIRACSTVPTLVAGGLRFTTLAAGGEHVCGLTTDGTAYCWGRATNGALGGGFADESAHRTPAPVSGALRFASISAGGQRTCALTGDGTAYCWGAGAIAGTTGIADQCYGFLCALTPVAVPSSPKLDQIAVGYEAVCGLAAQTAYCWGTNAFGELGDGTTTDHALPARVSGGLAFERVFVGWFSCATTPADVPYCWGRNDDGMLGVGTIDQFPAPGRTIPTLVGGAPSQ